MQDKGDIEKDIKAVLDSAKHYEYRERGVTPFNRLSSLSESKKHLKRAIKERIQGLVASYISLATFIDDDLVDAWEEASDKEKEGISTKIYKKVLKDYDKLRKEMESFNPFEDIS